MSYLCRCTRRRRTVPSVRPGRDDPRQRRNPAPRRNRPRRHRCSWLRASRWPFPQCLACSLPPGLLERSRSSGGHFLGFPLFEKGQNTLFVTGDPLPFLRPELLSHLSVGEGSRQNSAELPKTTWLLETWQGHPRPPQTDGSRRLQCSPRLLTRSRRPCRPTIYAARDRI